MIVFMPSLIECRLGHFAAHSTLSGCSTSFRFFRGRRNLELPLAHDPTKKLTPKPTEQLSKHPRRRAKQLRKATARVFSGALIGRTFVLHCDFRKD